LGKASEFGQVDVAMVAAAGTSINDFADDIGVGRPD
jgi:hypothetical protein